MSNWNPHIELIEGEIHKNFLREAYAYAWDHSHDVTSKIGAVIVSPSLDKIIACGANHFPDGLNPTKEQIAERTWKYEHIIHAEPSAIFSAARNCKSTERAVMYLPWIPCTPCAKAIIDAGIKQLIGHKDMIMKTPEHWQQSTDYALKLLEMCGVRKFMYDGKIGGVENLFDGKLWYP